ncbi:MAG TPA: thioredoxin-disulfide reductase [Candidatus Aminicenantes bacterium]|nr:MAG: thioredoxin-disulfide reductase [Candidatus Aminicenantes bacterium]HEK85177.1 thioredoxin-disulfide reductase [Candidatus Aminicenantes bacterium]
MLEFGLKKEPNANITYDVIILGAGPAGLTAAIYTSRSLLKTLVIDPAPAGGLASTTEILENYPGFPDGIKGPELTKAFKVQAERFGAEVLETTPVNSVELSGQEKVVATDKGSFKSRSIIIASGTRYKEIGVKGEKEYRGRGVSYCATCDAPLFKGKDIVVVGCGSSGIQESLHLLKFVNSITLVEFLPHMTAEPILQERIKKYNNVTFLLRHRVTEIYGDRTVRGVKVEDLKTGISKDIKAEGVFIFVGLIPNAELFKDLGKDRYGFILTEEKTLKTNLPGVYVAGDVRSKILRQVATAVGDGALAAYSVKQYLDELEAKNN